MRWHSSAAKAAAAIGMAPGTYSVHESGQARISDMLTERLADAFGVTVDFLRDGTLVTSTDIDAAKFVGMDESVFKRLVRSKKLKLGDRLKRLRQLRGYRSASEAARSFGFVLQTYLAHEAGSRVLAADDLTTYAYAYDVPVAAFAMDHYDARADGRPPRRRTAEEMRTFVEKLERKSRPPTFAWMPVYESPLDIACLVDARFGTADAPIDYLPVTREMLDAWTLVPEEELAVIRSFSAHGGRRDIVLRLRTEEATVPLPWIAIWKDAEGFGSSLTDDAGRQRDRVVQIRLPIVMVVSNATVRKLADVDGSGIADTCGECA